jgi:hypothetical protein
MKPLASLLLLSSLAFTAQAEQGPLAPPCSGCPVHSQPPYPQVGFWYDPERPGTGFTVDIQDGRFAAAYYGFDEAGDTVWYIVNGTLSRSEAADAYWEVEAPLIEFADGQALNGEYRAPQHVEAGTMRVEFMQRNLMRFSVDGGAERRMVPLVYGTDMHAYFPAQTDFQLPHYGSSDINLFEREKPWIIVETNPAQLEMPGESGRPGYGHASTLIHWANAAAPQASQPTFRMNFAVYDGFHYSPDRVYIKCGLPDEIVFTGQTLVSGLEADKPICTVRVVDGDVRFYYMPLADLGDRRFKAVDEEGRVIEGFRLNHD